MILPLTPDQADQLVASAETSRAKSVYSPDSFDEVPAVKQLLATSGHEQIRGS